MRLRQVAQRVENLGRAVEWYQSVLGVAPTAVFDQPGLAFFDLDGVRLLLDINAPTALIYLDVDDVEATFDDLLKRGYVGHTEPHVVFSDDQGTFDRPGEEWLAFVWDPEGNAVGLMGRRPL